MENIVGSARHNSERIGILENIFAAVLAFGIATITLPTHAGDTITGPARVIDGDTIEVQGEKIRLEGIDAPEMGQPCHSGGDCGERAKIALSRLVRGVEVSCTPGRPGQVQANPRNVHGGRDGLGRISHGAGAGGALSV